MDEPLKYYAYAFLALRVVIDAIAAGLISYQTETLAPGVGLLAICGVFYIFLYLGIRKGEYPGRYGRRVCLWREPSAFWVVTGVIVIFHFIITALMLSSVRR